MRDITPIGAISIHTPLAGSDHIDQSPAVAIKISIHTPLAGSDKIILMIMNDSMYFNPHSPCGERPQK